MTAGTKSITEPEGVTYAEVDAGGVPALWAVPEGADPNRALLHFHFGGSVTASMHSDRKAAGHIAKAAGARPLVVAPSTCSRPRSHTPVKATRRHDAGCCDETTGNSRCCCSRHAPPPATTNRSPTCCAADSGDWQLK
jgi:hypothetical protein